MRLDGDRQHTERGHDTETVREHHTDVRGVDSLALAHGEEADAEDETRRKHIEPNAAREVKTALQH